MNTLPNDIARCDGYQIWWLVRGLRNVPAQNRAKAGDLLSHVFAGHCRFRVRIPD
jgi:hypothetical protein